MKRKQAVNDSWDCGVDIRGRGSGAADLTVVTHALTLSLYFSLLRSFPFMCGYGGLMA